MLARMLSSQHSHPPLPGRMPVTLFCSGRDNIWAPYGNNFTLIKKTGKQETCRYRGQRSSTTLSVGPQPSLRNWPQNIQLAVYFLWAAEMLAVITCGWKITLVNPFWWFVLTYFDTRWVGVSTQDNNWRNVGTMTGKYLKSYSCIFFLSLSDNKVDIIWNEAGSTHLVLFS